MAEGDKDQFLLDHFGIDVSALRGGSASDDSQGQEASADGAQTNASSQTADSAASPGDLGGRDASSGGTDNSGTLAASTGSVDAQDAASGTSDTTQATDASDTTDPTDASDTADSTGTPGTDNGGASDNGGNGGGRGSDNGDAIPEGPSGNLAPGCTEQPTYAAKTPVPITINADNLPDFIARSNEALGGFPHCNIDVAWAPAGDDNGKITKANITVTTEIIRPRLGMNRASDRDLAIMQKAVALIQQHEEHHRDIARQIYATAPCAIVGKTGDKIDAILKTYSQRHDAAQAAYDKQSGKLVPVVTDGQITDVQLGPL